MAITDAGIAEAQAWINAQQGGSYDSTGQFQAGNVINNGVYDTSDEGRNRAIVGAANAMGYDANDMAKVLGISADTYGNYKNGLNTATQDIYEGVFNANRGQRGGTPTGVGGQTGYGYTYGNRALGIESGGGRGGGFGGGRGGGGDKLGAYTQNPYLAQMGAGLQKQFNDNLTMNTLPAIRGGAMAAGGVGGSRQGIAEGLATGQSNTGAANAITNLYGQDYGAQMGRNLQKYGMDQQYDLGKSQIGLGYFNGTNQYNLGMGQLSLGNQNSMQNFYTNQRGQDMDALRLGASLYGLGDQGEWSSLKDASSLYAPYTGYGNTTTSSSGGGTDWAKGLGNGLAAYQQINASNGGGGNGGMSGPVWT